tara:strand:- start:14720 stop:15643 length:924 start_codon:yes stop_codon:yes gene_type:complete
MVKTSLINSQTILKKIGVITFVAFFLVGCAEETKRGDKEGGEKTEENKEKKDANLMKINGKIFSVPSPIQTAFLLKHSGAAYSSEMLSPTSNASNLPTSAKKALNLGIYGADMGYATIYDQTQDAISFMAITKRLSAELGMTNIFDETMIIRFEANLGNQDSLLALVSDAFKSADSYLKTNEQNDLSVLILAGGWIETLHFATNIVKTNDNQNIKNRIGEQKITIKNLISLMLPFQDKTPLGTIINQLNELNDIYDGIEFNYTYKMASTDEETKTTTINSTLKVDMSPELLADISAKVEAIRLSILK